LYQPLEPLVVLAQLHLRHNHFQLLLRHLQLNLVPTKFNFKRHQIIMLIVKNPKIKPKLLPALRALLPGLATLPLM